MAEAFPVVLRDPIEDENTLMIGGRERVGRASARDGQGPAPRASDDRPR